jgi:hypothetical protein
MVVPGTTAPVVSRAEPTTVAVSNCAVAGTLALRSSRIPIVQRTADAMVNLLVDCL